MPIGGEPIPGFDRLYYGALFLYLLVPLGDLLGRNLRALPLALGVALHSVGVLTRALAIAYCEKVNRDRGQEAVGAYPRWT